jgi:phage tail-like protein
MAVVRETPYSAFNFLVEVGGGGGTEVQAGFAEVSGLSTELTVAEYRRGNAPTNYIIKVPGTTKAGDVTLKRGITGDAEKVFNWLEEARTGQLSAKKTVRVKLLSEDRSKGEPEVVVTWELIGAMPMKWTGPSLNAKGGGDVAMEELVLSVENVSQV